MNDTEITLRHRLEEAERANARTYFIPTDKSPWVVISRPRINPWAEWRFEDFASTRCVARVKAFWLRRTRGCETRVVRAWIPTR